MWHTIGSLSNDYGEVNKNGKKNRIRLAKQRHASRFFVRLRRESASLRCSRPTAKKVNTVIYTEGD